MYTGNFSEECNNTIVALKPEIIIFIIEKELRNFFLLFHFCFYFDWQSLIFLVKMFSIWNYTHISTCFCVQNGK